MAMQRAGILPDLFMLLNYPKEDNEENVMKKFDEADYLHDWTQLSYRKKESKCKDYLYQYTLNIHELKKSYKSDILEIDDSYPS